MVTYSKSSDPTVLFAVTPGVVRIPVVYISDTHLTSLSRAITADISVSSSSDSDDGPYELSRIFLDIAIFFVMACTLSSIVATIYFWRRRNQMNSHHLSMNREHAEKIVNYLKNLPPLIYTIEMENEFRNSRRKDSIAPENSSADEDDEAENEEEKEQCAVCIEDFQVEQEIREVPGCKHRFHLTCVDPWLISNQTCPLCKHNIIEYVNSNTEKNGNTHHPVQDSINGLVNVTVLAGMSSEDGGADELEMNDVTPAAFLHTDEQASSSHSVIAQQTEKSSHLENISYPEHEKEEHVEQSEEETKGKEVQHESEEETPAE